MPKCTSINNNRTWEYDPEGFITQGSYWTQNGLDFRVYTTDMDLPYAAVGVYVEDGLHFERYKFRVFLQENRARYHLHRYSRIDVATGDILHSKYDPTPEPPEWAELLTVFEPLD